MKTRQEVFAICGRYFIDDDEYEIQQIIKKVEQRVNSNEIKTGEVYPTNIAPVISANGVTAKKWGYPRWNGGGAVINARSETALEKNMFRKSLLERRCVVPSSGFYEWHRVDGKKQKDKYHLTIPGQQVLYMAGMWNSFKSPEGDCEAFVILTTSANDSMKPPEIELSLFPGEDQKPIHDRMPLILAADECEDWLNNSIFMELALHRPGPALRLELVT